MTNLKGKNTLDNEEDVRKFLKKCGKFIHVAND